uniref:Uncharacterized protein n=1 Tax=uncultured Acidobacteria bacterium Rifle_16ft_4_minimus_38982 TaxID=1665089 RepID=A0A0H4TBN0_9BACT|nr:hypothetical protein [uncultured Acidobacteria bacterium Rifle_16ft_4_minimus_38982]
MSVFVFNLIATLGGSRSSLYLAPVAAAALPAFFLMTSPT